MSEMSLQEQIKAVDEIIEYFEQIKRDINHLNEEWRTTLLFFARTDCGQKLQIL